MRSVLELIYFNGSRTVYYLMETIADVKAAVTRCIYF